MYLIAQQLVFRCSAPQSSAVSRQLTLLSLDRQTSLYIQQQQRTLIYCTSCVTWMRRPRKSEPTFERAKSFANPTSAENDPFSFYYRERVVIVKKSILSFLGKYKCWGSLNQTISFREIFLSEELFWKNLKSRHLFRKNTEFKTKTAATILIKGFAKTDLEVLHDFIYKSFPRNVLFVIYMFLYNNYCCSQTVSYSVQTTNLILAKLTPDHRQAYSQNQVNKTRPTYMHEKLF